MNRRKAPRIAGQSLRVFARSLRAPLAGRAIAQVVVRELGLDQFRREIVSDEQMRPAIGFRPGLRLPPDSVEDGDVSDDR